MKSLNLEGDKQNANRKMYEMQEASGDKGPQNYNNEEWNGSSSGNMPCLRNKGLQDSWKKEVKLHFFIFCYSDLIIFYRAL